MGSCHSLISFAHGGMEVMDYQKFDSTLTEKLSSVVIQVKKKE